MPKKSDKVLPLNEKKKQKFWLKKTTMKYSEAAKTHSKNESPPMKSQRRRNLSHLKLQKLWAQHDKCLTEIERNGIRGLVLFQFAGIHRSLTMHPSGMQKELPQLYH